MQSKMQEDICQAVSNNKKKMCFGDIMIFVARMFFLWRRKWQATPVFLPGESHEQRSLVGYSPQGHKELDTTEKLTHKHMFF